MSGATAPVAALALVVAGIVAVAGPAAAGDPVAEASARVEQARAVASEAAGRLAAVDAERSRVEAEVAAITESIPWLRARATRLESVISERAAALYRSSEAGPPLQFSHRSDPVDDARRAELSALATERDADLAEDLRVTTERLAQAESDLRSRTAELDTLREQLQREQADFDHKLVVAEEALQRAIAIGGFRAKGTTPVLGPSALSAEHIAAWFRASGGRERIAGISLDELTALYVEEGAVAGVRGDIAFAQSMVETGAFGSIGPNNFAGLGACDSCSTMTDFPTPRDGIRAQMQHLRNYADATSRADTLGSPPSPFWYGRDPVTAARNFDGFFAKGWAPTWEAMGGGNWATDPGYAGKVLTVYDRMLEFGVE
jgi:hypothetical protein